MRIYHNPRCSKSRQTLELIRQAGIEPEIVLYLETPPDEQTLRELISKLGIGARDLLRKGEDEYRLAGLTGDSSDEDAIAAMLKYPRLIERPIVVNGQQAVLGRPPENVQALLA